MYVKLKLKYDKLISEKNFAELLSGSVLSFATKIINLILGFLFSLMITRWYGAEVMGVYSLITSFLMFVLILSILGMNTAIVRIIPEHIVKYSVYSAKLAYIKIFKIVLIISFGVTIVSYSFSDIIASNLLDKDNLVSLFAFASIFIIPQSIMSLCTQVIRGFKEIKLFSIIQVLNPIFKIFLLFILYMFFNYTYAPVYVLIISNTVFSILLVWLVYRLFNKKEDPNNKKHKLLSTNNVLSLSLPMFLTSSMIVLILEIDTVMIGMFGSLTDVGIYAVVVKLAMLSVFMISSINVIAGPKFSELFHSNKLQELETVSKQSTKLAFYTTLPLLAVLLIFGEYLLGFFGEEFKAGYNALVLLVIGQMISTSAGPEGYFLNMTGNQVVYNYILIIAALINIMLNYFLIPTYGIEGAAFASMITKLVWMLIASIYIKYKFGFYIGYIPFLSRIK